MSTKELTPFGIVQQVNKISKAGLSEMALHFVKALYYRGNPTPAVSPWSLFFATSTLFLRPNVSEELQLFTS